MKDVLPEDSVTVELILNLHKIMWLKEFHLLLLLWQGTSTVYPPQTLKGLQKELKI